VPVSNFQRAYFVVEDNDPEHNILDETKNALLHCQYLAILTEHQLVTCILTAQLCDGILVARPASPEDVLKEGGNVCDDGLYDSSQTNPDFIPSQDAEPHIPPPEENVSLQTPLASQSILLVPNAIIDKTPLNRPEHAITPLHKATSLDNFFDDIMGTAPFPSATGALMLPPQYTKSVPSKARDDVLGDLMDDLLPPQTAMLPPPQATRSTGNVKSALEPTAKFTKQVPDKANNSFKTIVHTCSLIVERSPAQHKRPQFTKKPHVQNKKKFKKVRSLTVVVCMHMFIKLRQLTNLGTFHIGAYN
jgi:hypothetical protein